jgi:hypothetical protein
MNSNSHPNRRSFFKAAATTTATILAAREFLAPQASAAIDPDARSFATRNEFLSLDDGTNSTGPFLVTEVSGGYPFFQVNEDSSTDVVRKAIGNVSTKPMRVTVPGSIPSAMRPFIETFLKRTQNGLSGSVVYADANFVAQGELNFEGALMTELSLPALDAASRERFQFQCVFDVGNSARFKGDRSKLVSAIGSKQTSALVSNFRLTIPGLETAMRLVNRIEPITITQPVVQREGETVDLGSMNVSDLIISLSESGAKPLYDWFEAVLGGDKSERTGTLELLGPDLRKVITRLELRNLGLWWLAVPDGQAESIRRVTAKMFCEEVRLLA